MIEEICLQTELTNVQSPLTEIAASGECMDCPKCGSKSAKYEEDHSGIFLRCFCGWNRLFQSKYADGSVIDHIDIEDDVTLPKQGTKLSHALGALHASEPCSTGIVTEMLNIGVVTVQTNSDVASQLTILRYKGLVEIVQYKRGVTGGSVWKTTEKARKLLGRHE